MCMRNILAGFGLLLLAGCSTLQESTPIRAEAVEKGLVIVRALPSELPAKAYGVPDSQYVLVTADSLGKTLVTAPIPIPFVGDYIVDKVAGTYNHSEAGKYKERFASIDPYAIAIERMQGSPLLKNRADAFKMMPFVYVVEGSDDVYRLTLVYRIEGDGWLGRYLYALPTTFTSKEVTAPSQEKLAALQADLQTGSEKLRELMERDARGELKSAGGKVILGSYYLVGGRIGGFVSAGAMRFPDIDLIEKGTDYVIVRSKGDLKADANAGSLLFGVHYFKNDQLHYFKEKGVSSEKK